MADDLTSLEARIAHAKHGLSRAMEMGDERWTSVYRQEVEALNKQKADLDTSAENKIKRRRQDKIDMEYGGTQWRRAKLAKMAGKKALGIAGSVLDVGEHYRAAKSVSDPMNKKAPFSDRLGAYAERVLGAPPGTVRRNTLPSERQL